MKSKVIRIVKNWKTLPKKFRLMEQLARNPGSLFHRLTVSADF